jgi:signal peptidase
MATRLAPAALSLMIVLATGWMISAILAPVRITGNSMQPALHAGDLAIVLKGGRVVPGEIALIEDPVRGDFVHRVVALADDGALVTRGDANPTEDAAAVSPSRVAGRVVGVVTFGRIAAAVAGARTHAVHSQLN